MGRIDYLRRVLRTPVEAMDGVVARAMRSLAREGRPTDEPRQVVERIEELQRSLQVHKEAYLLAEAAYAGRLRSCQITVHRLRGEAEGLTTAARDVLGILKQLPQDAAIATATARLREVVPHA